MTTPSIPDEVRQMIGKAADPVIMEVERGAIRRFADAIDDPNPLYRDVEYARNSRYGEMIAPPGFFGWPIKGAAFGTGPMFEAIDALARAGFPRLLDGGMEYDYSLPVRAGDILTAVQKVVDVREREGRAGKMAFVTVETNYTNQNGDLVAKARASLICL